MLVSLINDAPRSEPLLRIYKSYMAFNLAAVRLLDLSDGDKVFFGMNDRSNGYIYVGKARLKQSYALVKRGRTFVLYNAALTRKVAEVLEGTGKYRICPEDMIEDELGNIYYNIFKKKYGN